MKELSQQNMKVKDGVYMLRKNMNTNQKGLFYLFTLIILSFSVLIIIGDQGVLDLCDLIKEKENLCKQNSLLEEQNVALFRVINRLRHDAFYLETIARTELGMIGKNEMIYQSKEKIHIQQYIKNQNKE